MIFIHTYNTVQMFGVCTIFVVFLNTNDAFIYAKTQLKI